MRRFLLISAALAMSGVAHAALITDGFTFAVASDCVGGVGAATLGHHYHSNTGGSFGNPAGLAEVGEYGGDNCEEVRGLSEYSLAGLVAGPAYVTFEVFQAGGLFPFDGSASNDFPFDGTIQVDAYAGNNSENVSDFQAATRGIVGTFLTNDLIVGNTLSFDITGLFADALTDGLPSFGIRLAAITDPNAGAWVFNDFRLTSSDDTTRIPEPSTLALLGLGLLAIAASRRKKA